MTVEELLTAVADQYGIRFNEQHTGGGHMALEAQLESGHWIVATDEGLCGIRHRIEFEQQTDADGERHAPLGWFIGIYPDAGGGDAWSGVESILEVTNYDAYAADLPVMVGEALRKLVSDKKQD